ncbi:hypothetical protein GUJ93_ZPchr0007g3475 [Zizania palustris]|uniref:DUF7086 domain-containing protein n=1 Tax=Zizania palustris TaxID=103762 RepID=A0A8J5SPF7_ZIZPA|nr:hypothetical protein GUJ93_ZPchr0007g3475 [Zizania palustris]
MPAFLIIKPPASSRRRLPFHHHPSEFRPGIWDSYRMNPGSVGNAGRFRMEEKLRIRMVGWTREGGDDVDDPLALTLGSIYASVPTPPSEPHSSHQECSPRHRLNGPAAPLFAPAQHDTLEHLLLKGITSVEGVVRCKRCFGEQVIAYDLKAKFHEVRNYVATNRLAMNDRAPDEWMCPRLPDCVACGKEGSMSPVIPSDKREINWMFLFLGQSPDARLLHTGGPQVLLQAHQTAPHRRQEPRPLQCFPRDV